jgi:hypothetical protein
MRWFYEHAYAETGGKQVQLRVGSAHCSGYDLAGRFGAPHLAK